MFYGRIWTCLIHILLGWGNEPGVHIPWGSYSTTHWHWNKVHIGGLYQGFITSLAVMSCCQGYWKLWGWRTQGCS